MKNLHIHCNFVMKLVMTGRSSEAEESINPFICENQNKCQGRNPDFEH